VYHSQYLYLLGGFTTYQRALSECERYVCADRRWEVLPALLFACFCTSAVVLENRLYTLGGNSGGHNLDSTDVESGLSCLGAHGLDAPQVDYGQPASRTEPLKCS
jgi:hypothetical protein